MSEWTEVRILLRAYASLIPTRLQLDLTCAPPSTLALGLPPSLLVMATTERVDLDSLAATDPKKAEAIYKSILQGSSSYLGFRRDAKHAASTESKSEDGHDKEARLKEQESALVKLAELYRDQKSVSITLGSFTVS
jgi:hypothetical protein